MKPTANMIAALEQAQRAGGELTRTADTNPKARRKRGEKPPPWPVPPATIAALIRHDLLAHSQRYNKRAVLLDVYKLTDAGRLVLNPPPKTRKDTPQDMRAKGKARTLIMVGGVWTDVTIPEPEKVNPNDLSPSHGLEAQKRWDQAQDRRAQAHRLANRLRAA